MPSRNLLVILVAGVVSIACYAKAERNRYVSVLAEAMSLVEHNFLEPVDERTLFQGAMDGMVGSLGDQYSSYIPPSDFGEFQESLDQQFGGVGIVVEMHPETKLLTVMSPLVNTPAYAAGLRSGDVILEIDGQSTRDMAMSDAVAVMRGKPGSEVALTVRRPQAEAPLEFRLQRAIIPVESVLGDTRQPDGSWNYFLEENPRIGYIRMMTFGDHTVEELFKALRQYEKHEIDALILDLRDNAGGYLNAAIDVSNMLIDTGRIVSTRGRDGAVRASYEASPSKTQFPRDKPMAVLVNGYTASAAEIVAACLQDHGRAVVVGMRSWGKGTVQNVIPIEGGDSALKLTTASYWRPSGKNIHRGKDVGEDGDWGVRPDPGFVIPLSEQAAEKIHHFRRQRDIVLRLGEEPPPYEFRITQPDDGTDAPDPEDDGDAETSQPKPPPGQADAIEKWSDDPQLRRAVEHLQEQIETKELAARKA
ncbi:MAG: S41 family peptidase [Planctomycetes bacterium]|nr:S41 family peptidase [Planctomycetota bacterium]